MCFGEGENQKCLRGTSRCDGRCLRGCSLLRLPGCSPAGALSSAVRRLHGLVQQGTCNPQGALHENSNVVLHARPACRELHAVEAFAHI